MAKLGKGFDANQVDPGNTFEVIPEGWYKAQLDKSDLLKTKAGDGSYLALRFKILDGEHKGRMIFTNLNIDNPNPVAVEIAERNFSQLCHAVGILVVQDTEELHNIPLEIRVGINPPQGQYDAKNDVKGYRPLEGTPDFANKTGTEAPAEPPQNDAPPPSDEDVPAWLRE